MNPSKLIKMFVGLLMARAVQLGVDGAIALIGRWKRNPGAGADAAGEAAGGETAREGASGEPKRDRSQEKQIKATAKRMRDAQKIFRRLGR